VENTGPRAGDEVLQLYHSVSNAIRATVDHPVPLKKLIDFERVSLAKGAAISVGFTVPRQRLAVTNGDGDYVLYKGSHTITFSRGAGADTSSTVFIDEGNVEKNNHDDPGLPPKYASQYV